MKNRRKNKLKPQDVTKLSNELVQKLKQVEGQEASRHVPVSVTMIVKNAEDSIGYTLESLHRSFILPGDEILIVDTGSTDDTKKICRKWGATVIDGRVECNRDVRALVERWLPEQLEKWDEQKQVKHGCVLDFAAAREISRKAAKHDTIFWVDSDDVFEEDPPFGLRRFINKEFGKSCNTIYLNYYYSFDPSDGQVNTVLKRERVVDRRLYKWIGKCHETLIANEPDKIKGTLIENNCGVFHRFHRPTSNMADTRNYCIIRSEIEDDLAAGREPDVRSIFYLGNACRGLEKFAEAKDAYERVLRLSGSRDDRYTAAYYIAVTYMHQRVMRPLDCKDWCFKAIRIKPDDPRAYFLLSRACASLRQFPEAVHWFSVGETLPPPSNSFHTYDTTHVTTLPYETAVQCAIEMNRPDMVETFTRKLEELRPGHEDTKRIGQIARNYCAGMKLVESVQTLVTNTKCRSAKDVQLKIAPTLSHVAAIPDLLERQGISRVEPEDKRPGRDLVFYCGHTDEPWGPENAKTGIGGSEKMVILMAPRLQKLGWKVSVYANVPTAQRGIDAETGVNWRHWAEFDYHRFRDTVICWRNPGMVKLPIAADRRIVWCHDVQNPAAWDEATCALVDQAWLLSAYHAETLGDEVKERLGDKLVITRNGITPELFEDLDESKRKPKRVVYCSSPDRGVLTAISTFAAAFPKALHPDAELVICYGFTKMYWARAAGFEYCHIPDIARDANMYEYAQKLYEACDLDSRIKFLGRVNWQQLAEIMKTSKAWLYPTRFPEISCMAAMESQAAGLRIVATDYAALAETIDWSNPGAFKLPQLGQKADLASLKDRLFSAVMTPRDDAEYTFATKARERFSVDSLAEEWNKLLS